MRKYYSAQGDPIDKVPEDSTVSQNIIKDKMNELRASNNTIRGVSGALATGAGVWAVVVSSRAKKGFWWGVGSFIAASAIVGTITTLATIKKVNKNNAELDNLKRRLK